MCTYAYRVRPPHRAALVTVALVPLGTVAGHVAGYVLAGQHAGLDGGHSHLRPLAWVTAAAALAGLGWVAAAGPSRAVRLPAAGLATAQVSLFVLLESAEHVAGGHGLGHLLAEPGLRWGLAAQLATAAVLVLATSLARASGDRVRALFAGRPRRRSAEPTFVPASFAVLRRLLLVSSASERGPPHALVPA